MQADPSSEASARRGFLRVGLAAATAALCLGSAARVRAQAQQPQIETLRILCGAAAGSTVDLVARRVAEQLNGRFAQRAIVDNRPGAAGHIAANALKAAAADGTTLLLAPGGIATVHPYTYPSLGFDPAVDLQPVSMAAEMTMGLAVGPAVPASVGSVRELVDWMRLNPKLANVGSPGTGSLPHLLEAMLFRDSGVEWQHVIYPGGPPALVDLLGGQIAALVLPEGILRAQRRAGKLRMLATSGAQRSAWSPDVPSFAEQGYPALVLQEWFAFFLPGRAAAATVDTASQAVRLAIAQPELVAAFAESAIVGTSSTPAALAARIAAEQRIWEPVIRAAGIRAE